VSTVPSTSELFVGNFPSGISVTFSLTYISNND
jgi:hypothetical protein